MVVLGGLFFKKLNFEESQQTKIKNMNNSLACKYIGTEPLQNNVSFNNSEFFSYKKCIKPCNSTFNLLYFILN